MFPLLLWLACTGPGDPAGGGDPPGADGGADGGLDDTATPDETGTPPEETGTGDGGGETGETGEPEVEPALVVEEVPDQDPDLDGWIFDPLVIHEVELTLSDEARAHLDADPYTFVDGSITFDGVELDRVGVRLRGKIGSFRYLSGKPKFKIDFNEFVEDQRFHGLESISLNNSVVDCSYLKEPLAYRVMQEAGIPASRTSWAKVTVNGAAYGLYVVVETPDDRFLARTFEDPEGNLYDGKYVYRANGSYELLDFATGDDDLFQLEEGTDVDNEDIARVSAAVSTWWGTGRFEEQVGVEVDFEHLHRLLAAEQWVGHNDGYAMNTNNYRVYFDPLDGRAKLLPWDFDYSFLNDYDWGMSWGSPAGTLASGCWRDENCHTAQGDAVEALVDTLSGVDLVAFHDEQAELTYGAMVSDPRRECGYASVMYTRDLLRAWLESRNASILRDWGR